MTTALVIGLLATPTSGANGVAQPGQSTASAEVGGSNPFRLVAPEPQSNPLSLGVAPSGGRDAGVRAARISSRAKCSAHRAVRFYQRRANEHRAKMGAGRTGAVHTRLSACPRYLAALWQRKAFAARRAYESWFERTYEKWRCIHEHEGAWNDPNPPHYGGLQFDDDFQRGYGPEFYRRWGDAGNWPVWAQLIAAERAYLTRGFGPWPNTRRMCGL